jgi:hypothetical protein
MGLYICFVRGRPLPVPRQELGIYQLRGSTSMEEDVFSKLVAQRFRLEERIVGVQCFPLWKLGFKPAGRYSGELGNGISELLLESILRKEIRPCLVTSGVLWM